MKTKGMMFKDDLTVAIREGRKTMTRRVIKPQPPNGDYLIARLLESSRRDRKNIGKFFWANPNPEKDGEIFFSPAFEVGDIMYVKETWRVKSWSPEDGEIGVEYKTGGFSGAFDPYPNDTSPDRYDKLCVQSCEDCEKAGIPYNEETDWYDMTAYDLPTRWRSKMMMPKSLARKFYTITDVRAERLQDISEEDALADGGWEYKNCPFHKAPEKSFAQLWDSINKEAPYRWEDNPYVWVYDWTESKGE